MDQRSSLSGPLEALFEAETFTDVIVLVGKSLNDAEEILAHRAVLASQSSAFREIIQKHPGNSHIHVDKYPFDTMYKIIRFLYSGSIALSDADVVDVFLAANEFDLPELRTMCEEHVSKSIAFNSLITLLRTAKENEAVALEYKCHQFFRENAVNLFKSEAMLEVPEDVLKMLLLMDFRVDEADVFDFIVRWANYQRHKMRQNAVQPNAIPSVPEICSEALKYVRYVSVRKDHLRDVIVASQLVEDRVLVEVLFHKLKGEYIPPKEPPFNDPQRIKHVLQEQANRKWYLSPRRGLWKVSSQFSSESEYADYLKSVLRPGMMLRANRAYENVVEGDIGEFVTYNAGVPPCQVRWYKYGSTYWLHWKDVEIIDM